MSCFTQAPHANGMSDALEKNLKSMLLCLLLAEHRLTLCLHLKGC